jgi:hypothetical protein
MTHRAGLAFVGLAACLLGCGLRTDPDYSPVCVDDAAGGTGDTGGTSGEPRVGSCEDPIDLPAGESIVVRGALGGCSGSEGWCGGSGAEDVYRLNGVAGDVFVDFIPQETNFNPVLRVVRDEDPCGEGLPELSEVCADIKNSVPGRGFYDQGGVSDQYYLIVDTELGESGEYAFWLRFGPEAFEGDCLDALEDQVINLGPGGDFAWEADLDDDQGRVDSGCGAAGNDHVFQLVLDGPGTVQASVEAIEGDIQPIVSLRNDCATVTELSCGPTATASFGSATSTLLVVDNLMPGTKGRYRLTVTY